MNNCPKCGSKVEPGVQFCENCGTPLSQNANSQQPSQMTKEQFMASQFGSPQATATPVYQAEPVKNDVPSAPNNAPSTPKKSKSGIIPLLVVIALLLCGAVGYFFVITSPKHVYQTLYKKALTSMLSVLPEENNEIINKSMSLSVKADLDEELVPQEIQDLINKLKLATTVQYDNSSKKVVVGIDADYDKDSLLDVKLFADIKNDKVYLYAKDYYAKYVEIPVDNLGESLDLDSMTLTDAQIKSAKQFKKILVEELAKTIESEDCYKENGAYIYKVKVSTLFKRYSEAFERMANNKKILDCFEDEYRNDVAEMLRETAKELKEAAKEVEGTIKIKVTTNFFGNEIKTLTLGVDEDAKIEFTFEKGKVDCKFVVEKETVLSGYIKYNKTKTTSTYEISAKADDMGSVTVNFEMTDTNDAIDTIDTKKVVKYDQITETELESILEKFQDSMLYQFVAPFIIALDNAKESAAKSEAAMIVSGINNYCATADMKYQLDGTKNICADGVTIAEVSQMVDLGNAKVDYVSFGLGRVQSLMIESNGYTVIYDGVTYSTTQY